MSTPVLHSASPNGGATPQASLWTRFRHEWFTGSYIVVYLVTLALATSPGGVWTDIANALFFPMGAIVIWAQAQVGRDRRLDKQTRNAWSYLSASSASIWISGLLWTLWLDSNVGKGSPLWSDALDAVYIPLAVIAFLRFPSAPRFTWRDRRLRLDACLLALGGIGLSWNFGLRPLFQTSDGSFSILQFVVVLGEWAVVLAASIAYLRAASHVTRRSIAIAFGAHVLFILSDYFWTNRQDVYAPGHWVDAVWFSAWVFRWIAARHAIRAQDRSVEPSATQSVYRSGIAPTAFVAGAYTLLVHAVLVGDSSNALGIGLVASTMTALLLVRQSVELSENRRLTRATAVQAARFRSLISHASDFVMLIDDQHEVVYVSPSAENAGIASVGCSLVEMIHPDDQDSAVAWLEDRSKLSHAAPQRCRLRGSSTEWRDVEFRAQDRRADPHVRGFVVNGRDISDEVALESRLRHAQKLAALHEMAGRIAHAFNNALASIQGHAELLAHEMPMSGTVREDVDAIRAAAERGSGITRQLLGFSGRHVIQPVPLHPGNVTRELIPTLTRLVASNVNLSVDIGVDVGTVLFDRAQFEQVLVNLVANAGDSMPAGGTIRVSVQSSDCPSHPSNAGVARRALIQVADRGSGISDTLKARIFEPFFTTKTPGRGTGLGLAMVQAIVSRAGGTILVESNIDGGTTFTVSVPISNRVQLPARPTPKDAIAVPTDGTILLVDDDAAVRRASRRILEHAGYTVVEVSGGAMAIELAKGSSLQIDILVTDMMMPEVSGRDVIAAFRQLRPGVPIVCVTGYAESEAPLAPEVHAIVAKPFTAANLVRAVATAIATANHLVA